MDFRSLKFAYAIAATHAENGNSFLKEIARMLRQEIDRRDDNPTMPPVDFSLDFSTFSIRDVSDAVIPFLALLQTAEKANWPTAEAFCCELITEINFAIALNGTAGQA